MSQKTASIESINLLYTNMGKNFSMFTPMLCSFVSSYEQLELEAHNESQTEQLDLYRELIKINIASMVINMDLSTFLRADFRSVSTTEKRCNLKYINVITCEGFNYFFGKKDDDANAIWLKFRDIATLADDKELNNDILNVTTCANEFKRSYFQSEDINSRNLSVHYDKNPISVYDDIVKLSEDEEVKRASAFLAILESLSLLTSNYFRRNTNTSSALSKSQQIYDLSIREIINSFQDKNDKLSVMLNDTIINFGGRLDGLIQSCNKPKLVANKLSLNDDFTKKFKPIIESIYPGLHLHFIYLDLACAMKAYLKSEYYFEKQMNLRRIRIVLYEGFKKIYGFTSAQESNSFWKKYIYSILHNSTESTTINKLTTIEDELNKLREYRDFNDYKKREYSIHYRYKEEDNIISIFHQLIDSNAILEMDKALKLLRLLPTIIELNDASLQIVNKNESDKVYIENSQTLTKIDSIISMIEASNADNEMKKEIIGKIKAMTKFLNR